MCTMRELSLCGVEHPSIHSSILLSAQALCMLCSLLAMQLLVWDLRKSGGTTAGVLQFGGTGLYHHRLLASHGLEAPLATAKARALTPARLAAEQDATSAAALGAAVGGSGGGVGGASGGALTAAPGHVSGSVGGRGVGEGGGAGLLTRWADHVAAVDQLLLHPHDPTRVGLVLQVCRMWGRVLACVNLIVLYKRCNCLKQAAQCELMNGWKSWSVFK